MSCSSTSSTSSSTSASQLLKPIPDRPTWTGNAIPPSNYQPLCRPNQSAFAPVAKRVDQVASKPIIDLNQSMISLPVLDGQKMQSGILVQRMVLDLKNTFGWIKYTKDYDKTRDWESELEEGRKKAQNYKKGKQLGSGAFGMVRLCEDRSTKARFARKEYIEGEEEFKGFLAEQKAFKILGSVPYLIHCHDSYIRDHFRGVIVLEYLNMDRIQGQCFSLPEVRKLGFQLFSCLTHFKKAGLIHGDIARKNIDVGIKTGLLKLFDLNLAVPVEEVNDDTELQTLWYRAPEVMLGKKVDCAVDMWSAGVVLTELFMGKYFMLNKPAADQELGQLQRIIETIGHPSQAYIHESQRRDNYFELFDSGNYQCKGTLDNPHGDLSSRIFTHGRVVSENLANMVEYSDLVTKLLCYEGRLTPTGALAHPFFSRFLFLEFVVKHPLNCHMTLFVDDYPVMVLDLANIPLHSMQSCKRGENNQYRVRFTDKKSNEVTKEQEISLASGDVFYIDKEQDVTKKV